MFWPLVVLALARAFYVKESIARSFGKTHELFLPFALCIMTQNSYYYVFWLLTLCLIMLISVGILLFYQKHFELKFSVLSYYYYYYYYYCHYYCYS